jgi:hypothetical protein
MRQRSGQYRPHQPGCFQEKVCFAQAAGAIGVIIGNYENTIITMGGQRFTRNVPSRLYHKFLMRYF